MIKDKLESLVDSKITKLGWKGLATINVEHPDLEQYGNYSTNIAMVLAKKLKRPPMEVASDIVGGFDKPSFIEKIDIAPPGFINFFLKPSFLIEEIRKVVNQGDGYGSSSTGKGKTMIIDYSSPNIAKRFTIGHLRSTIIGQALYNLYQFCGWKVIGDNHLGDWGTQFGKMIVAVRKWAKKPVNKLTIDEMEDLYVKFHQEAEKDPSFNDEARKAFKALEDGKKDEREMWEQMVEASMAEFQKLYKLLGVNIDVAYGESFYEDKMARIIQEAKEKGVAIESQGALVINYPDSNLLPGMILKSDGATTYLTRDLATIVFRKKRWNPDLVIYEVGSEQILHFKQVFAAAELLGWDKKDKFIHIPHGRIRFKEGKMSTRLGKTIKLEEVLQKAIKKARKFNDDPRVAEQVGVGAIKYNDLKSAPTSGYIFDWDEMLKLEGNSGPYLQYTCARCKSVLRKAKHTNFQIPDSSKLNQEEIAVIKWIYRFPEVVIEACQKFSPNLICNFLFDLAQRYNAFYNKHSVLSAKSKSERELRLLMTAAVAQVLKNGLLLLGIEVPEKM